MGFGVPGGSSYYHGGECLVWQFRIHGNHAKLKTHCEDQLRRCHLNPCSGAPLPEKGGKAKRWNHPKYREIKGLPLINPHIISQFKNHLSGISGWRLCHNRKTGHNIKQTIFFLV